MNDIYEVPYWVDSHVEVKKLLVGEIPSSVFQNNTEYRLRLVGLSFVGEITATTPAVTTLPTRHPGWSSLLLVDIGKSGCSDQNLVRSSLTNLCGTPRIARQKWGANNMGRSYWLPTPYRIEPEEGLRVEVQARWPGFDAVDDLGTVLGTIPLLSFVAKGYDIDGYPVQLAGMRLVNLEMGGSAVALNNGDLFNNGKKPLFLTQFCFKGLDTVIINTSSDYGWNGCGAQLGWRVNPANPAYTQMMPNPSPIPVGLLTPLDRCYDGGSESPLCYWFPADTYLDPKQALSVRFSNIDDTNELDVRVCMFGQLEVM